MRAFVLIDQGRSERELAAEFDRRPKVGETLTIAGDPCVVERVDDAAGSEYDLHVRCRLVRDAAE